MQDTHAMMTYDAKKKSAVVGYLLWFVLGIAGAHRFYFGKGLSGFLQLVLGALALLTIAAPILLIVWGFWWFFDAIAIPRWTSEKNLALADSLNISKASVPNEANPVRTRHVELRADIPKSRESIESKLETLKSMRDKALISDEEYQSKRDKILSDL